MTVIRSVAHELGERCLGTEAIAALQGVSVAAVERSLGNRQLFVSERSGLDLGVDAAGRCLARAGVAAADVDVLIWCGLVTGRNDRPPMYVQDRLGATQALVLGLVFNCTEVVTALAVAQGLLRDGRRRALIVAGANYGEILPTRTVQPLTERTYESIFSDAGLAMLVDAEADEGALQLLGTGSASVGSLWDHLQKVQAATTDEARRALPTMLQVLHRSGPAHQRALAQCLDAAKVAQGDIDHLLFAREPGGIEVSLVRHMGFDPGRLFDVAGGPTHTGSADQVIGLEQLMNGAATPGQTILYVARTVGMMRCALFKMGAGAK